ncbi:MAG: hypothetical protein COB46_10820 [Rhodospirillaceae bacterium]|nr:MAG: hypothetical protein COB46_10820 [Rhodospirillaceae bacterium]
MPNLDILRQHVEDLGIVSAHKLVDMFYTDVQKRIAFIQDYQENGGEQKELHLNAHSLKGLCRTYGADQAGEAAMQLQAACEGDDETLIQEKIQLALGIIPADSKACFVFMNTLKENVEKDDAGEHEQ